MYQRMAGNASNSEDERTQAQGVVPLGRRFEAVVSRRSSWPALQTAEEDITYRELNRRANRVAHLVLRHTGGRSGRIALLYEQSIDAVASLLGVLKAGCAFVPLDAAQPRTVLEDICHDCQPEMLMSNDRLGELAAEIGRGRIAVQRLEEIPPELPDNNPELEVSPDALAFVFYTSGTTGKPKGVCQTQRNLHHFVSVYSETLAISSGDRLSLLYSMGFGASNKDVFSALLNGATLCMYDIRKEGIARLADWLDAAQVSILHMVPTVFRHLASSMAPGRILASVRGIDLGGEALFRSDIGLFKAHFRKDCLLVNHLAATEASVIAQYKVDPDIDYAGGLVPVGYASRGVKVKIVSPDGLDAPIGQPGEMVICSPYISPGYLNRDALNHKTFGWDEANPGHRIYRSGDLGYVGHDGKLYFLGRADSRVKISGYLVDTNEVEAAIRTCLDIKDVAVIAKHPENEPAARLVAFLVAKEGIEFAAEAARKSLGRYLAAYKIPAAFVCLDALPKSNSGKIDRHSLARMDYRVNRSDTRELQPEDALERTIAGLCAKILGIDQIGRLEDFFLLGGSSLQAMELHKCLEIELVMQIPMQSLFEDSTVAGMTACIRKIDMKGLGEKAKPPLLVPLRQAGSNRALFLIHGMNGQAFASSHFLEMLGSSQPVYAFQATGLGQSWRRYPTVEKMSVSYIEAARNRQPSGPYFLGGLCSGCLVALEMAHRLRAAGEVVAPLLMIDPPLKRRQSNTMLAHVKHRYDLLVHRRALEAKWAELFAKRRREGHIDLELSNARMVRAATNTALCFRLALRTYRDKPYDGSILLLSSRQRLAAGLDEARRFMTGDVHVFEVSDHHGDIHTVGNERFKLALRQALDMVVARLSPD